MTYYSGDSAVSQVSNWNELRKSTLPFAKLSIFTPDWPHGLSTAFCLSSEMIIGQHNRINLQSTIAFILTQTKKIIENDSDNVDNYRYFII